MSPAFEPEQDEPGRAPRDGDFDDGFDADDIDEDEFDDADDPDDDGDDDDDEDDLDAEFPMGDGVADLSANVHCPYCGEPVEVALDPGSGSHQEYVEDCQVCCQPWRVSVYYQEDGQAQVNVAPEDER